MGSTCSTLDGADAPRSRVSQIELEQREKDAAALVKQNAEAAHKIAEAEHKQLVASLTSAERDKREHYKRRAAWLAKSPAHARRKSQPKTRKDEKIFPDGQDSVNVAGLGAEEHLAAIHADQFHRLLRADSFDDFQDM